MNEVEIFFYVFGCFDFGRKKKKKSGSIIYARVSVVPNFKFETILTHPKKTSILCYYSAYMLSLPGSVYGNRAHLFLQCFSDPPIDGASGPHTGILF